MTSSGRGLLLGEGELLKFFNCLKERGCKLGWEHISNSVLFFASLASWESAGMVAVAPEMYLQWDLHWSLSRINNTTNLININYYPDGTVSSVNCS